MPNPWTPTDLAAIDQAILNAAIAGAGTVRFSDGREVSYNMQQLLALREAVAGTVATQAGTSRTSLGWLNKE